MTRGLDALVQKLRLRDIFRPRNLLPSLTAGVLIGLMEVFFSISFASLIFSGPLADRLPLGIGLALFGTLAVMAGISLFSSQVGIFSTSQDVPAVLMAVIASRLASGIHGAALLPTILAVVALSTLLTGLLLVLLGQLRLGGLVRYFPYPVIGGFLAATGWLLVTGAFPIMTRYNLSIPDLPLLLRGDQLLLWLPGVVIAVVLFLATRFVRHPMAIPGVILGALVLFYGVIAVSGISLARVTAMGFFFSGLSQINFRLLSPETLRMIDWGAILPESGNIAVLMGMSLVGMLLNTSAIELVIGREFDLNRELRAAGMANILSGLGGGLVGYHTLSTTIMSSRIGARSRLAGLIGAVVIAVVLFSSLPVLSYIPKALVGGVLLFLGLDFLYDWVLTGWSRFSLVEYGVVLMILVIIVLTDFMTGVAIGLMAMVIMFAISYSRTRVILRRYSSAEVRSMVIRSQEEGALLERYGDCTWILEMQGFLFFGTANVLVEEVKRRLRDSQSAPLEYLVIDFHRVTGIDSSAGLSFQKACQLIRDQSAASGHQIEMILTGVTVENQKRIGLQELINSGAAIRVLPNLDQGVEWCENMLVAQYGRHMPADENAPAGSEAARSNGVMHNEETSHALPKPLNQMPASYYSIVELDTGEMLIRKGEAADCIYYLMDGLVSIYVDRAGMDQERSNAFGAGSIVGEIGLFLGPARTAFVVADQPTRLLKFTRPALEKMYQQDAILAIAFHEFIIQHLAMRVLQGDLSLRALRR